jgi:mRNA interferase HigB
MVNNPAVLLQYDFVSIYRVKTSRVMFNIKGNHNRLIVRGNYDYGMVWIIFIGTHAQYDKIDGNKI